MAQEMILIARLLNPHFHHLSLNIKARPQELQVFIIKVFEDGYLMFKAYFEVPFY